MVKGKLNVGRSRTKNIDSKWVYASYLRKSTVHKLKALNCESVNFYHRSCKLKDVLYNGKCRDIMSNRYNVIYQFTCAKDSQISYISSI